MLLFTKLTNAGITSNITTLLPYRVRDLLTAIPVIVCKKYVYCSECRGDPGGQ